MSGERGSGRERRGWSVGRFRRRVRAMPPAQKLVATLIAGMLIVLVAILNYDRGWEGKRWQAPADDAASSPGTVADLTVDAQLTLPRQPMELARLEPLPVPPPVPAPPAIAAAPIERPWAPRPPESRPSWAEPQTIAPPATRPPALAAIVPPLLRPELPPRAMPPLLRPLPPPTLTPRRTEPAPPRSPGAVPRLAVIIDDVGNDLAAVRRAQALPAPVTLAFLPTGIDNPRTTAATVAAGHEVFLHLPMEPLGGYDPGQNAILVNLSPAELERRFAWALARVPHAVGVNNHMGSRATLDPWTMLPVMQAIKQRGLVFVDSRTVGRTIAGDVAANLGVPRAVRDVFLDNDPTASAIRGRLAEAERTARERGQAVVIGHPYPSTLTELAMWLPQARRRGVTFVKASALARGCQPQAVALLASCDATGTGCVPPPVC